ncbi:uncharacterized protein LOC120219121 [Hibiscus syriacus]|uniref:uncharacterized protein LOC120219121 n=1 Tax=Hibiscus syriacus TaxID=106335 RepID=UPI001922FD8C|nr:uncharacterized protein LOC120219121 [Hibiscus syriacus]
MGRLFSDNVLIAHELLHYLKTASLGVSRGAAVQIDVENAYDRVEWSFLRNMMLRLGFALSWVSLIMSCVTSVTYCARVNGCLTERFRLSRDLRQGDPLSPFLFLLCSQGMSCFLHNEQRSHHLQGLRGDSSYLWSSLYSTCEFNKFSVYFCVNTTIFVRVALRAILGVSVIDDPGRYIGASLVIGRNMTTAFGFIRNKLLANVRDLETILRSYWWASNPTERGWPMVAWETICRPKHLRDLEFRNLRQFNLALLGKLLGVRPYACKVYTTPFWLFVWGFTGVLNPLRCGQFMHLNESRWNENLAHEVFQPADAAIILACQLSHCSGYARKFDLEWSLFQGFFSQIKLLLPSSPTPS